MVWSAEWQDVMVEAFVEGSVARGGESQKSQSAGNMTTSQEVCNDEGKELAFLASSSKHTDKSSKRMMIQRDRQATMINRAAMEMHRTTRLAMTIGETQGTLKFVVPINKLLLLPLSVDDNGDVTFAAAVRTTLFRRFEYLQTCRQEDDEAYIDAVRQGTSVSLVKALPKGYSVGGWRCHAMVEEKECHHPNKAQDECCSKCRTSKPNLKPCYTYLRLLLPGMRQQRRQYVKMIRECDSELQRCEAAEMKSREKISYFDNRREKGLVGADDEEVELMMDVDLIQKGVWQRGNARSLLRMLVDRKKDLHHRLRSARVEVAIMIQCMYEMAVVHAQKIVRRFLIRCNLERLTEQKYYFARLFAAVEIQRLARGKITAKNLFIHLRKQREYLMATKIQSIIRMRNAVLERRRRWDVYFLQLCHKKATVIQSLARECAAKSELKRLAELRRLSLEEIERARVALMKKNSATLIQSVFRRIAAIRLCNNRRIEMSLHDRLLIYLERFAIDGCMWSLMKSINDDYLRFERTIKSIIVREETMAKTFCDLVVKTRDKELSSAWNRYHSLKVDQTKTDIENKSKSMTKLTQADTKNTVFQSSKGDSEVCTTIRRKRDITVQIYETALAGKKRMSTKTSNKRDDDNLYRREASQLSSLEHAKERLRGAYTRFDIPNGLDDTVARFIKAVALRYNYDSLGESYVEVEGSDLAEKKCLKYSDDLIYSLHEKGFVFIRQLLPTQYMHSIFHSFKVDDDFILLSHAMLIVLQQMKGVNLLSRRYLMTKCNSFLDIQMKSVRMPRPKGFDKAHHNLMEFLGECDAAGCKEEFDDEIPAGLFETRTSTTRLRLPPLSSPKNDLKRNERRRTSSWAVKFSQKIINENEANHPAYRTLKRGKLLVSELN